jgi:hypothetical protein
MLSMNKSSIKNAQARAFANDFIQITYEVEYQ